MNDHTRAETLRQAVAQLAQETQLKVVDRLDDPMAPWVQIIDGPHKTWLNRERTSSRERWVRLTIDTDHSSLDDETHRAHVEMLKAHIRQSLRNLLNYRA